MIAAPENSEVRRVLNYVKEVRDFGESPTAEQWESVLPWAEPLIERDWLDGAPSRDAAEKTLSLAMCVLGDAYRELNRPADAVRIYKRALDLLPGAPCIDFYVKLVLDHHFDAHYAHAATSLKFNRENWRQRPLWLRAYATVATLFSSPRSLFRFWRDLSMTDRRIAELQRRAESQGRFGL